MIRALLLIPFFAFADYRNLREFKDPSVIKTTSLEIPGIAVGFNPSMVAFHEETILLAFRHQPSIDRPWESEICFIVLDKAFQILSEVHRLNLRSNTPEIPSRTEDPRLVKVQNKIYLLYNDNLEPTQGPPGPRRDMYLVEVIPNEGGFRAGEPVLLKHPVHYPERLMEKNWVPFVYRDQLLVAYSLNPHEVLLPDLQTGTCEVFSRADLTLDLQFEWGPLRGGTPAIHLEDGSYFAFFHSFRIQYSNVSRSEKIPHYFFGAYHFDGEPPFAITAISPHPIVGRDFYTQSAFHKRVVYPSGVIQEGDCIHICCGRDDHALFIVTLDKQKLLENLGLFSQLTD